MSKKRIIKLLSIINTFFVLLIAYFFPTNVKNLFLSLHYHSMSDDSSTIVTK